MFKCLASLMLVLLAASPLFAQAPQPAQRQYWMGEMATGSAGNPTLAFMVTLWQEGDSWRGTLDIPPGIGIAGVWAMPFLNVDLTPGRIELVQPGPTVEAAANTFSLTRTPEGGDTAQGAVLIAGAAQIKAWMWRVDEIEARDFMPRRPQTADLFQGLVQRDVMVPNTRDGQTVNLKGVLTLPPGDGPHPAVVLVNALDVYDTDHNSMGHRPYALLADRLARAGIATLRTEDRRLSQQGFAPQIQITIEELGTEAAERTRWLAAHKLIDASRIGLLGLNEGAVAAAIAATQLGEAVNCIVLLAPQAVNGLEQLRGEFSAALVREGETPDFVKRRAESFIRQYQLLLSGAPAAEIIDAIEAEMTMQRAARRQQLGEAAPEIVRGLAEQQHRIINTPHFKKNLALDPAPVFSSLRQPALTIVGGKDVRFIAADNLPVLQSSLGSRQGIESVIRLHENLNSRLQPAISGAIDESGEIETTLDEAAIKDIIEFLSRNLRASAPKENPR